MNFWNGEKVRLRGIEPSDAEFFFQANFDSERARFLDFVWPPASLSSVQAWAERLSKQPFEKDVFFWVIEDRNGLPVGSISTYNCHTRNGTFAYGVDVVTNQRRKGFASEAILLVLRYYFDELRYQKVTVPVHSNNTASILLHEQLGFQQEGVHRRMVYTQGQHFDEIWFGMTIEEFHTRH